VDSGYQVSTNATLEILRAYLASERLVLCRAVDTAFPLDGLTETLALYEIISVVHDATNWEDITQCIPKTEMERLMEELK
jgi:hypothetical protein